MSEAKKEIKKLKETVQGMQSVAYDAMERMSFQASKAESTVSKKKSADK